jgi:hypothetical protein
MQLFKYSDRKVLPLINIMTYFLKARTVESEEQPLLGNGCVTRKNRREVGRGVFCAVRAEAV